MLPPPPFTRRLEGGGLSLSGAAFFQPRNIARIWSDVPKEASAKFVSPVSALSGGYAPLGSSRGTCPRLQCVRSRALPSRPRSAPPLPAAAAVAGFEATPAAITTVLRLRSVRRTDSSAQGKPRIRRGPPVAAAVALVAAATQAQWPSCARFKASSVSWPGAARHPSGDSPRGARTGVRCCSRRPHSTSAFPGTSTRRATP